MFSCSAPTWRSKVQIPDSSCFQKHSAPPPGNLCSSLFYVFFISQVRPTAFISNSNLSCVRLRSCLCVFAGVEVRQSSELRGKNLFKDLGRRQTFLQNKILKNKKTLETAALRMKVQQAISRTMRSSWNQAEPETWINHWRTLVPGQTGESLVLTPTWAHFLHFAGQEH